MADLEQILNKRRSSLATGQRRQFSVARTEAVRKMRKFALEDPRYYLLELIQSAVANDSEFISIDLFRVDRNRDDLKMRWTGEGFSRIEMLNLFDVLLESELRTGRADIQMFARAVNAILLFEPRRLLLASGGRGRRGITCEIRGDGTEIIEIRDSSDFYGVHILAAGLKDSRLPKLENAEGQRIFQEKRLIQKHCVMPDVSVIFNGRSVSHHTWTMHDRDVSPTHVEFIEEADLQGEIWRTPHGKQSFFDLLTWGVKIDRVRHDVPPFDGMSGSIIFNQLNKTADHAKIVRDEHYQRMWARVRPYVDKLRGKRVNVRYDVARPGTDRRPLEPRELLEILDETDRLLLIEPSADTSDRKRKRADQVADSLGARLLVAESTQDHLLRLLAGTDVELIRSDLSKAERGFYLSDPASPPARPWLVEPAEIRSVPIEGFAAELVDASAVTQDSASRVEQVLGEFGSVSTRVYTPEAPDGEGPTLELDWVHVLTCEREVWSGTVATAFPGHVLFVDLPATSPTDLQEEVELEGGGTATIASLVGEHAVREAHDELEWAASRAVAALGRVSIDPGSHASRIALYALGRRTVLSLSHRDGKLTFSMLAAEPDEGLMDVPLFVDADEEPVGARRLEELLQHGIVYIARDWSQIDPTLVEHMRPTRSDVLILDDEQERLLVNILGGDSLRRLDVDLDKIDVEPRFGDLEMAKQEVVRERVPMTADDEAGMVRRLIEQLRIDDDGWQAQEQRRRARRQWLAIAVEYARQGVEPSCEEWFETPVVETMEGARVGMGRIFDEIERSGFILMSDGRAEDVVPPLSGASSPQEESSFVLRMNPYLAALLGRIDGVRGPEDASLVEHTDEAATIARTPIEASTVRGFVAMPAERAKQPVVSLVHPSSGDVRALREVARRYGVVGTLSVAVDNSGGFPVEEANEQVNHHARLLLEEQMEHLSRHGPAEQARSIELLLDYAGRYLRLTEDDHGWVTFDVLDDLALRILELPLFPTERGVPISGVRLVREFCRATSTEDPIFLTLSAEAPEPVHSWVAQHLNPGRIYREATDPPEVITLDEGEGWYEMLRTLCDELGVLEQAGDEFELLQWPSDRDALEGRFGFNRNMYLLLESRRQLFVVVERKPTSAVVLVRQHPLLERLRDLSMRECLSWLVLGVYAAINRARGGISNQQEMNFHRTLTHRLLPNWTEIDGEDA